MSENVFNKRKQPPQYYPLPPLPQQLHNNQQHRTTYDGEIGSGGGGMNGVNSYRNGDGVEDDDHGNCDWETAAATTDNVAESKEARKSKTKSERKSFSSSSSSSKEKGRAKLKGKSGSASRQSQSGPDSETWKFQQRQRDEEAKLLIEQRLASLQLPEGVMPERTTQPKHHDVKPTNKCDYNKPQHHHDPSSPSNPPTIRILVAADIDLSSASALAEAALRRWSGGRDSKSTRSSTSGTDNSNEYDYNPLKSVDLCIACGPFCSEEDIQRYYRGRQLRKRRHNVVCRPDYYHYRYQQPGHQQYRRHHYDYLDGGGDLSSSTISRGWQPTMTTTSSSLTTSPLLSSQQHQHHQSMQYDRITGSSRIPFSQPHQYRQHQQYQQQTHCDHDYHNYGQQSNPQNIPEPYPYKRTMEETAALEGLVTAAISQLESIVCRVVFVPSKTDPVTTLLLSSSMDDKKQDDGNVFQQQQQQQQQNANEATTTATPSSFPTTTPTPRRLTPNSRNVHQQWIPLAPGLGVAGLAQLQWEKLEQEPPPFASDDDDDHGDDGYIGRDNHDDDESDHHIQDDDNSDQDSWNSGRKGHLPDTTQQQQQQKQFPPETELERLKEEYGSRFCHHLQELVERAPPVSAMSETPPSQRTHPQVDQMMVTSLFQSILVTQFHHWEPPNNHKSYHKKCGDNDVDTHDIDYDHCYQARCHHSYHDFHNTDEEDEEESFDPPWPSQHEAFCALPVVQEHVLLEIAAGRNSKGQLVPPMEVPKGPLMKVVLPGSLREGGEFCLIDVSFMKDPPLSAAAAATVAASTSSSLNNRTVEADVAVSDGHYQPKSRSPPKKTGMASSFQRQQRGSQKPEVKDQYRWRVRKTTFYNLNEFV